MGWVWVDDDNSNSNFRNPNPNPNPNPSSDEYCSTRKIVKSKCNTEEVEPGKFIRKCENTHQILRDCLGKPTEIVQSNKEYTEEDVTNEVKKGSSALSSDMMQPFDFPGLRSDIEAIERSVFGVISRFFEAADEMRNEFKLFIDDPTLFVGSPSSVGRREIPIEGPLLKEPKTSQNNSQSGDVDFSGLARDV